MHQSPLGLLTYEQKMFDDRLAIEFGRTSAYHYFFLPNGLDSFTNTSTVVYADSDFLPAVWPLWGARATYYLTHTWYLQAWAFEDNYRRKSITGAASETSLIRPSWSSACIMTPAEADPT